VIHYKPERGSCAVVDPDQIYLCDSGAQYLDGTTDTTRTLHFGTPTAEERRAYTLVLKGNIALDVAVFPKGTTGYALDAFARQFLWVRQRTTGGVEAKPAQLISYGSKRASTTVTAPATAWART